MKIALCEDDSAQADMFVRLLDKTADKLGIKVKTDAFNSVADIKDELEGCCDLKEFSRQYDAYFLDIELGNDNGVELARYIKGYDINSVIIFTTSHTDYMSAAFDVHAFNYIVKPVTEDKVDKIVTQLEQIMYAAEEKLVFSYNRQTMSVYYDDIVYMESVKRVIKVVTTDSEYTFYGKINDVYKELPQLIFGRTRSGCIVNYRYISRVDKSSVWCRKRIGEEEIQLNLGRGRYNDFMTDYAQYITSARGRSRRMW